MFSHPALGQDQEFVVRGTIYSAETGMPLAEIGVSAVNAPADPVSTDTVGVFEIVLQGKNEQLYIAYPGYKEKTVFVSSHVLTDIDRISNYIGVINEGKTIFSGSIKDMKKYTESNTIRLELDGNLDLLCEKLKESSPT